MTLSKCYKCDGTGKFLKPDNEEKYDLAFDQYDRIGVFNHSECHMKALKDVGYTAIECKQCNGTGNKKVIE